MVMAVHGESPYPIGNGRGWRRKASIREDFLEEEACELNSKCEKLSKKKREDGVGVDKHKDIEG